MIDLFKTVPVGGLVTVVRRLSDSNFLNQKYDISRDWTHIGTIWTSKADELPGPSTIKFKFKFKENLAYTT